MYEGEQFALYRSLASLGTCTLLKVCYPIVQQLILRIFLHGSFGLYCRGAFLLLSISDTIPVSSIPFSPFSFWFLAFYLFNSTCIYLNVLCVHWSRRGNKVSDKINWKGEALLVFFMLLDTKDMIKNHMNNLEYVSYLWEEKNANISFINKEYVMVTQSFPTEKIFGGGNDANTCDQRFHDVHSNCSMPYSCLF